METLEIGAESLVDKAQRVVDAHAAMEKLFPTLAGPGMTTDMAEIAFAFVSLAAASEDVLAILKEEKRMRKEYAPGVCNAEDAWRDFGKEKDRVWRNFRAAVEEINTKR